MRLKPQSQVLLPGDGEGRNSVWLAEQRHHSTAMDNSTVGLEKAAGLAAQRGVTLNVVNADLAQWTPEPASYDAIVLTYVHLPAYLRQLVHQRLAAALRPAGGSFWKPFIHCSWGPARWSESTGHALFSRHDLR